MTDYSELQAELHEMEMRIDYGEILGTKDLLVMRDRCADLLGHNSQMSHHRLIMGMVGYVHRALTMQMYRTGEGTPLVHPRQAGVEYHTTLEYALQGGKKVSRSTLYTTPFLWGCAAATSVEYRVIIYTSPWESAIGGPTRHEALEELARQLNASGTHEAATLLSDLYLKIRASSPGTYPRPEPDYGYAIAAIEKAMGGNND